MRKGFITQNPDDSVTHVYDTVSAFRPDQSLTLRELLMQFAYIGQDRLEDIVNRGFDGDEDDDLLGVDVGALDYAEVHDRIIEQMDEINNARAIHNRENLSPTVTPVTPPVTDDTQPVTPPVSKD